MSDMMINHLKPPFSLVQGKSQQATGAGNAQEGNYQADLLSLSGEERTQVSSSWKEGWWRRHQQVTVSDTDAKPQLDIELVEQSGNSSLRIRNGDPESGIVIDIPLGQKVSQQEAFPSFALPMRKIDFQQKGSSGQLSFNDGQVSYTLRRGVIRQDD
jgi:hypothetical protein